jgi:hypothetical protein
MVFCLRPEEVDFLKTIIEEADSFFSADENVILSRAHYEEVFGLILGVKERFNIIKNPTTALKILAMARVHMATLSPPENKKLITKDANMKKYNSTKSTT